jgi:hypothetical protein
VHALKPGCHTSCVMLSLHNNNPIEGSEEALLTGVLHLQLKGLVWLRGNICCAADERRRCGLCPKVDIVGEGRMPHGA